MGCSDLKNWEGEGKGKYAFESIWELVHITTSYVPILFRYTWVVNFLPDVTREDIIIIWCQKINACAPNSIAHVMHLNFPSLRFKTKLASFFQIISPFQRLLETHISQVMSAEQYSRGQLLNVTRLLSTKSSRFRGMLE